MRTTSYIYVIDTKQVLASKRSTSFITGYLRPTSLFMTDTFVPHNFLLLPSYSFNISMFSLLLKRWANYDIFLSGYLEIMEVS